MQISQVAPDLHKHRVDGPGGLVPTCAKISSRACVSQVPTSLDEVTDDGLACVQQEGGAAMGQLWDMYESFLDRRRPFPPSQRKVAEQIGITATTLGNWRQLKDLPHRKNLIAFADLVGVSYSRVLDAALVDAHYLPEEAARASVEDEFEELARVARGDDADERRRSS